MCPPSTSCALQILKAIIEKRREEARKVYPGLTIFDDVSSFIILTRMLSFSLK